MTSPIDDLLARARLVDVPCSQADIDAAAGRIAARLATRQGPADPPATSESQDWESASTQPTAATGVATVAAQNLRVLCETVVNTTDALDHLQLFLGRCLPQPPGARVLGCILQLTGREESAQFWWQYAAGAGDALATYCLHLHHLALGEQWQAAWWRTQTDVTPATMDEEVTEQEIATALRILRTLKTGRSQVPASVEAVLAYVPAAVGFVDDDLDLPLPDDDFADRIHALTTPATEPNPQACGRRPCNPLPERKPSWALGTLRSCAQAQSPTRALCDVKLTIVTRPDDREVYSLP